MAQADRATDDRRGARGGVTVTRPMERDREDGPPRLRGHVTFKSSGVGLSTRGNSVRTV